MIKPMKTFPALAFAAVMGFALAVGMLGTFVVLRFLMEVI